MTEETKKIPYATPYVRKLLEEETPESTGELTEIVDPENHINVLNIKSISVWTKDRERVYFRVNLIYNLLAIVDGTGTVELDLPVISKDSGVLTHVGKSEEWAYALQIEITKRGKHVQEYLRTIEKILRERILSTDKEQ